MLKIFVYGTLKPGQINYSPYCEGKVEQASPASTRGKLYHLSQLGYPALVSGDEIVQGYLLIFNQPEAIQAIDQLEDYYPNHPHPLGYQRRWVEVSDPQGNHLGEAWAYFMTTEQVEKLGGIWLTEGIWSGRE